jgi:hypothetical protein
MQTCDSEVWRPIPVGAIANMTDLRAIEREGHLMDPSCYEASSLGRIRRTNGRILQGHLTPGRYVTSRIMGASKGVHRMVCWAFHGGPSDLSMWVNHRNGIKHDNRPENVEWVTPSQNSLHAWRFGLFDTEANAAATARRGRRIIVMQNGVETEYQSLCRAAKACGMAASNLHAIVKHGITVGGISARYVDGHCVKTKAASVPIERDRRSRPVERFRDGSEPERFESIGLASQAVGMSRKTIWHAIATGGTCGGYHWRRAKKQRIPEQMARKRLPCRLSDRGSMLVEAFGRVAV